MKISYAVVFYNHTQQLVDKLYRNLSDTVPRGVDYHLFLINNSPDNERLHSCLSAIAEADPHVTAIEAESNHGFGAGHNLVLKMLSSDYHFIVNPDIVIPNSEQISMMLAYMQAHHTVLLNPRIQSTDGSLQKLVKKNPTVLDLGLRFLGPSVMPKRQRWFVYDDCYDQIHEAEVLSGSFMVCRTQAFLAVGGFDERYFLYMEDTDLCRKLAQEGPVFYFPTAYVIHEWQRANRKSFKGIRQMLTSMIKYFNKWGWQFA